MSDPKDRMSWRTPALVALFGGIGGLTAWIWSITLGRPLPLAGTGGIAANVFLGVVAGFVGTYAMKPDASRVVMHTLALALLFGFAWKPLLEAGRELVITRIQDGGVAEKVNLLGERLEALKGVTPQTAPAVMEEIESATEELMKSQDLVRDPEVKAKVGRMITDSIQAISNAAELAPEAGARALGAIGAAALKEDNPGVVTAVSGSLTQLAEKRRFEVGTSSEVSNALARLSAAASAGGEDEQAGILREQSLEIVRQAQRFHPGAARELRERSIVVRDLPPQEPEKPR